MVRAPGVHGSGPGVHGKRRPVYMVLSLNDVRRALAVKISHLMSTLLVYLAHARHENRTRTGAPCDVHFIAELVDVWLLARVAAATCTHTNTARPGCHADTAMLRRQGHTAAAKLYGGRGSCALGLQHVPLAEVPTGRLFLWLHVHLIMIHLPTSCWT